MKWYKENKIGEENACQIGTWTHQYSCWDLWRQIQYKDDLHNIRAVVAGNTRMSKVLEGKCGEVKWQPAASFHLGNWILDYKQESEHLISAHVELSCLSIDEQVEIGALKELKTLLIPLQDICRIMKLHSRMLKLSHTLSKSGVYWCLGGLVVEFSPSKKWSVLQSHVAEEGLSAQHFQLEALQFCVVGMSLTESS